MQIEDTRALAAIQDRSYARAGPVILESYPKTLAMNAEGLAAFLESKRYAVLATSRRDGRPQAAPIAFTFWASAFWIASVEGARVRNLRACPYASIVIVEGEDKTHRAVVVEGPVQLHDATIEAMPEALRDLWVKRHGGEPTWASALIEVRPERLFSYDATKSLEE